jgi:hypothetical protein
MSNTSLLENLGLAQCSRPNGVFGSFVGVAAAGSIANLAASLAMSRGFLDMAGFKTQTQKPLESCGWPCGSCVVQPFRMKESARDGNSKPNMPLGNWTKLEEVTESLKSSRPHPIIKEILVSCQHCVPSGVEGLVDIGRNELRRMCDGILLKDLAESLEEEANQNTRYPPCYKYDKNQTRWFLLQAAFGNLPQSYH